MEETKKEIKKLVSDKEKENMKLISEEEIRQAAEIVEDRYAFLGIIGDDYYNVVVLLDTKQKEIILGDTEGDRVHEAHPNEKVKTVKELKEKIIDFFEAANEYSDANVDIKETMKDFNYLVEDVRAEISDIIKYKRWREFKI